MAAQGRAVVRVPGTARGCRVQPSAEEALCRFRLSIRLLSFNGFSNPSPLLNFQATAHLSHAPCGSASGGVAISVFQQALQMMTNQTTQPTDASQALNVYGTQGQHPHHHHRHSTGSNDHGDESFIDQLAQSLLNDLQQGDASAAASPTGAPNAPNESDTSFINGLASAIATNVFTHYHQASDASQTPNPTTVNAIA